MIKIKVLCGRNILNKAWKHFLSRRNRIGIAVIDSPLLVDHTEIKDNLKFYQSYSDENQIARIHGVATAKE